MKTLILKSGLWLTLATVFVSLVLLLNLNVISRVDQMVNRQEFEQFLNSKISEYLSKQLHNDEIPENIKAEAPDQAALMEYFNTVDPESKVVPKERLKESYRYTCELQEDPYLKSTSALQWQSTESNMGGRVRAVMWDPNDPFNNKIWAGGVTGGLWYKNDITTSESWIPVDDFWPGLAISCMTYDPNNPQTFYVGTGEAQTALIIYRESSGVGFGIMHSTDAGENWTILPGTENFEYVTDIEVRDENGTSVIYAAVASGVYKGSVHHSEPTDGLYRSVSGSGEWVQVLPNITGLDVPYAPSDIEVTADGRIFVGTMPNVAFNGAATILYSDEGTAGTWTVNEDYRILIENSTPLNFPGRVMLASAPSDPTRIYGLIASGIFYGIPAYECHIAIRSFDSGESWEMFSVPPNQGGTGNWAFIAWHALTAAVDPNDPDRVFVGALDLWVSDEAGDNWSKISSWTAGGQSNFIHADHHRILFQEGSSNEFVVATDGGIFYTVNGSLGAPVFQEKNPGFNTLQMYKIALSPGAGNILFLGGMQDNGTVFYDGNPIGPGNRVSGGDGGACFIDKNEPGVAITTSQNNRFYMFNNGQYVGQASAWMSGNFISSMDYDYNLNTIYANAVTVTNHLQDSILRVSGFPEVPLSGQFLNMGTGSAVPFTHVKYSEYSPENSATIYLGTQSGRLFRVENAESSPLVEEIGSEDFPTAAISCIALGRSEDTVMVTFSNYGVTSVWQSFNGGEEWVEKEGNLPDMPVRWAIYHPESAKAAMLATELGIWTSYSLDEESTHWQPDNVGLANVRVDMLQLREADYTVLAGTHGRGFYYTTFNYNPPTGIETITFNKFTVYPNPARNTIEIKPTNRDQFNGAWDLVSADGSILIRETPIHDNQTIRIDMSAFEAGTYFIRIKTTEGYDIQKILKL